MSKTVSAKFVYTALLACGVVAAVPACSAAPDTAGVSSSTSDLSSNERRPRYERIRNAAAAHGITNTSFLLAGIAMDETGLAQCWSEATWACQGPSSPDCNGGPVIAGSADGPCNTQQGGLGMFQFDAGNYGDTLRTYGNDVLTVDGQVRHAIDYVVNMVKMSAYTTDAETDEKARAWINRFDINNGALRDQWIKTVVRYYNGCPPGGGCWSARYGTYSDGLNQVLADTGGAGFWTSGTSCPGGSGVVGGAIEAKYLALGGCGSVLGVPKTDEVGTPDRIGRYNVFDHGSIYWTPATNAHDVLGSIRDKYASVGWEAGALGYPISDEYDVVGGRKSDFQHGSITWNAATNMATVTMNASPGTNGGTQ